MTQFISSRDQKAAHPDKKSLTSFCHWETVSYQVTLIGSEHIQAFVRSLDTNQTYIVEVGSSFKNLAPSQLLADQQALQENFYARVVLSQNIPVRVDISVRGLGGGPIYTQSKIPLPGIPQGNAALTQAPKTPQELVWVMRRLSPEDPRCKESLRYGFDYINTRSKKTSLKKDEIDGLVMLVLLKDQEITLGVISLFIEKIKNNVLLNLDLVRGLADAVNRAQPSHLNADDLVQLLNTIVDRMQNTHSTATQSQEEQLSALSRILNAMVDANVNDIPRLKHDDLKTLLETLSSSDSSRIKSYVAYAKEALKRVPDDESKLAFLFRHATGLTAAVYNFWMAFNKMDPKHLVDGFFAMQDGAKAVLDFATLIKENLEYVSDMKENFMSFKENLSFSFNLKWYEQARYIEWLIASNCFQAVERFLLHPKTQKRSSLLYLTVTKLHEVILIHPNLLTRKETIHFLQNTYQDDATWSRIQLRDSHFKKERPRKRDIIDKEEISDRLALKGAIIEYLQSYCQIPELKDEASKALTAIEKKTKPSSEEFQFIQRHRKSSADVQLDPASPAVFFPEKPVKAFNLESKLEKIKASLVDNEVFKQQQKLYVPLLGTSDSSGGRSFDLMQEVQSFLQGKQRVLRLVGEKRSGKRVFCQTLAALLWSQYRPYVGPVPLYISLAGLKRPVENLFSEFLKKAGLTSEEIALLKDREFIFILDDYGSLSKNADILEGNKLLDFKSKVIIACPTETLSSTDLFVPLIHGNPTPELLKEVHLAPFTPPQIEQFLKKWIELGNTPWKEIAIYRYWIKKILVLQELIPNPFTLQVIIKHFPEIIESAKRTSKIEDIPFIRDALFNAFIDQWFTKGFIRARGQFEKLERFQLNPQNLKSEALKFCIKLAKALKSNRVIQVQYTPFSNSEWTSFFGEEGRSTYLRWMAPLKVTKERVYSFIHPSLIEHFDYLGAKSPFIFSEEEQDLSSEPLMSPKSITPVDAVTHFERGKKLYEQKNYEEAIFAFCSALSCYPQYKLAQQYLEICLSQQQPLPKSTSQPNDLNAVSNGASSSMMPSPKLADRPSRLSDNAILSPNHSLSSEEEYQKGMQYAKGPDAQLNLAFLCFQNAAQKGHLDAQVELGKCYFDGKGVAENEKQALEWFKKAANQGCEGAQYILGVCYYEGVGVEKNDKEAFKWYKKSADQGYAGAQYKLGAWYANGQVVVQNHFEAFEWFKKAAIQGYVLAQVRIGNCYIGGEGVVENNKEAVEWYKRAANQGNTQAQSMLGACYFDGVGVIQDYEEAFKWYKKAADQGEQLSQYSLGDCYSQGKGVKQDYEEAFKWYKKSADQGYAGAQYKLGAWYSNGQVVVQNHFEAFEWYKKAADQGHSVSQYNLGICYSNGQGVEKNNKEAVEWYKKAADQGYAMAQYYLGMCYYYGQGIEKNDKETFEWLKKAAIQGCAEAKYILENHYRIEIHKK